MRDRLKEPIADWLIERLEIVWLWVSDRFQSKYYESLADEYRGYKTQGLKFKEPRVLDLDKVFVPLHVNSETLDHISAAILPTQQGGVGLTIWDFLAKVRQAPQIRRLAVIGPPGSGKTTMLEYLTLIYAQNGQRRQHPKAPRLIPVLLRFRDRQVQAQITSAQPPDLATLIREQPWIQVLNPSRSWFATRLQQGKCLVLLDGLDEVADAQQRQQVSHWVNEQMRRYASPFIVTSRPYGYRSAPIERVGGTIEVKSFNLPQVERFVHNWYLQTEIKRYLKTSPAVQREAESQATDLIERIKRNAPLAAMAVNPLLLKMIATVHCYRGALPGRRVELYAEICDVLLGRRQEAKQRIAAVGADLRQDMNQYGRSSPILGGTRPQSPPVLGDLGGQHNDQGAQQRFTEQDGDTNQRAVPLTATQRKQVLQDLALGLMLQNRTEFPPAEGAPLMAAKLAAVTGNSTNPATFFQEIDDLTGLLMEREKGIYQFAHKSFQEYLAAMAISQTQQVQILTPNLGSLYEYYIRFSFHLNRFKGCSCRSIHHGTIRIKFRPMARTGKHLIALLPSHITAGMRTFGIEGSQCFTVFRTADDEDRDITRLARDKATAV